MNKRLHIAIVGSSGQASAILLSRDGHPVEVFERAAELGPVGAGFLLQPVGQAVLAEMDLLTARKCNACTRVWHRREHLCGSGH